MPTRKTLSPDQVHALLREHPEWSLDQNMLVRTWTFPGFNQAIHFVNQVAVLAGQLDHHPDIDIRYQRVRLALISHDADALTPRDAEFIRRLTQELP